MRPLITVLKILKPIIHFLGSLLFGILHVLKQLFRLLRLSISLILAPGKNIAFRIIREIRKQLPELPKEKRLHIKRVFFW